MQHFACTEHPRPRGAGRGIFPAGVFDLAAFYAARFAVKEAVFKAVAPLTEKGFDLRIVESIHRPDGSPAVRVTEKLAPYLKEADIGTLYLSITTEGDYAAAMVVAE